MFLPLTRTNRTACHFAVEQILALACWQRLHLYALVQLRTETPCQPGVIVLGSGADTVGVAAVVAHATVVHRLEANIACKKSILSHS